jgi:hypothetical protein
MAGRPGQRTLAGGRRGGGGGKGGMKIKVPKTGVLKKPRLDNGTLTKIGASMVRNQLARWRDHKNANGNEAKPLSKMYTFVKKRALGIRQRPYRDQRGLTGVLIQSFSLRKAINNTIRAENTSRVGRQHANQAQQYEEMIGFSGPEQVGVFRSVQDAYGAFVKRAWLQVNR